MPNKTVNIITYYLSILELLMIIEGFFMPFSNIDDLVKEAMKVDKNELSKNDYGFSVSDNNRLSVQFFSESSYNGPRLEDFQKRLKAVYETAIMIIEKDKSLSNLEVEAKKAKLAELKQVIEEKINRECVIPPISFDDLVSSQDYVIQKINIAGHHLRQFLSNAVELIYPNQPNLEQALADFQIAEANYTAGKSRPDFLNLYTIKHNGQEHIRLSAQRVIGNIIPSTKRDEDKLANFVEVAVGGKTVGADGKEKIEIDFTGKRHSSFTPIAIKDKIERRVGAAVAVKDMFAEIARQKKNDPKQAGKGNSEENPIILDIASMSLLSPLRGDKFLLANQSEQRQLKESRDALMRYNNRPVKLMIDGEVVFVKPKINLMTEPTNAHGLIARKVTSWMNKLSRFFTSKEAIQGLEETVNAKGIYDFLNDTRQYIEAHLNTEEYLANPIMSQVAAKYSELMSAYDNSSAYQKANTKLKALLEEAGPELYQELENAENAYLTAVSNGNQFRENYIKAEKAYQNASSPAEKSKAKKEYKDALASLEAHEKKLRKPYDDALKAVRAHEKKLNEAYSQVDIERRKIFEKNVNNYRDLETMILGHGDVMRKGTPEVERKLFSMMQMALQAEAIHFSDNRRPHEFASRFLIANQAMGKDVDWYCKSGEDRTGRQQNFLEELFAYKALYDDFPRYDYVKGKVVKTAKENQQTIAKTVAEFSVSRDISGENAFGARGIQQSSGLSVNKGLANEASLALAHLAKNSLYSASQIEELRKPSKRGLVRNQFVSDLFSLDSEFKINAKAWHDFKSLDTNQKLSDIEILTSRANDLFRRMAELDLDKLFYELSVNPNTDVDRLLDKNSPASMPKNKESRAALKSFILENYPNYVDMKNRRVGYEVLSWAEGQVFNMIDEIDKAIKTKDKDQFDKVDGLLKEAEERVAKSLELTSYDGSIKSLIGIHHQLLVDARQDFNASYQQEFKLLPPTMEQPTATVKDVLVLKEEDDVALADTFMQGLSEEVSPPITENISQEAVSEDMASSDLDSDLPLDDVLQSDSSLVAESLKEEPPVGSKIESTPLRYIEKTSMPISKDISKKNLAEALRVLSAHFQIYAHSKGLIQEHLNGRSNYTASSQHNFLSDFSNIHSIPKVVQTTVRQFNLEKLLLGGENEVKANIKDITKNEGLQKQLESFYKDHHHDYKEVNSNKQFNFVVGRMRDMLINLEGQIARVNPGDKLSFNKALFNINQARHVLQQAVQDATKANLPAEVALLKSQAESLDKLEMKLRGVGLSGLRVTVTQHDLSEFKKSAQEQIKTGKEQATDIEPKSIVLKS